MHTAYMNLKGNVDEILAEVVGLCRKIRPLSRTMTFDNFDKSVTYLGQFTPCVTVRSPIFSISRNYRDDWLQIVR